MKIKFLYDQGSDVRTEDFPIFFPDKIMGIIDAGSAVFIPPTQPQMFYGMTVGQYTVKLIEISIFAAIIAKQNPETALKKINKVLGSVFGDHGLTVKTPENNPFASYAIAFFNGNTIEIIQGGDCQFVWQNRDGTFGWMKNQTLDYDRENLKLIAAFMAKHNGNRNAMWQDFGPILKQRRHECFNSSKGGFSLLNGQPDFYKYWQRANLDADEVEIMVGYTDGFVIQEETADMARLARRIIYQYRRGGLQEVLDVTREIAIQKATETHVTLPEATVVAIEL